MEFAIVWNYVGMIVKISKLFGFITITTVIFVNTLTTEIESLMKYSTKAIKKWINKYFTPKTLSDSFTYRFESRLQSWEWEAKDNSERKTLKVNTYM